MVEPTPTLACSPELARIPSCNRTAPRNPSISSQIRDAEFSAVRARDRPLAQTAHPHGRARSNDCPPNALWLAGASLGGCAARFLVRAPPGQVRLRREKAPSSWCHQLRCDRAVEYAPSLLFGRNAGTPSPDS